MYKRHFISASICLLTFIVGSQIASAQSQLAQDTYAIFEASCLNCHGPRRRLSRDAPHGTQRAY